MEENERRKAIELLKEMRSENKPEDGKSGNQETRLNWMYKGPSDLVDREEYLLGKAIDRTFEVLNSEGNPDVIGRTGEQSNVPRRILEKTEITEQVDIAKKILDDPLYAIKQKEMEARKKLLNNPVKLKQIKQMLLERSKQNSLNKQKRKKLKKKSEQDLNLLILKKLKKFTDKEKRKALNKIMKSDSDSSSTESTSTDEKEYKKRKSKRKRSASSSDESSDSRSSEECKRKKLKVKNNVHETENRKNKKSRSSTSDSSSYNSKRKKKSKKSYKKHKKSSGSSDSSSISSSSDSESSSDDKSRRKSRKDSKNSKVRHEKKDLTNSKSNRSSERHDKNKSKRENSADSDRKHRKNYGLMMPDGSEPEVRRKHSPVQKYKKNAETKSKYIPPPRVKPISEKEKEEKLREMMEDAKLRKRDREKNLANHRKKQAEEEKPKDYDDDFIRRQMSHLTSQGTMADRIKSNINNIQRSKSSMDTSFMRK